MTDERERYYWIYRDENGDIYYISPRTGMDAESALANINPELNIKCFTAKRELWRKVDNG